MGVTIADVVQHIVDFVVVKHLPRAVPDDSVLYVSRIIAHLDSIPRLLPPLPIFAR